MYSYGKYKSMKDVKIKTYRSTGILKTYISRVFHYKSQKTTRWDKDFVVSVIRLINQGMSALKVANVDKMFLMNALQNNTNKNYRSILCLYRSSWPELKSLERLL